MRLVELCDVGNIDTLERQLDILFADLGIDVEFSSHFKQRLRERGCEQGFNVEHLKQALIQFRNEKQRELKKLSDRHVAKELVLKKFFRDLENILNIVVGLNPLQRPEQGPQGEKIYSTLSGITTMAKKDFKPKNTDVVVLPTNETIEYNEFGGDSKHVFSQLVSTLEQQGQHWADAPGGRKVIRVNDMYGLEENDKIVAFATFLPVEINGKEFYQLNTVSNSDLNRGNFYRILSLLWTIKDHIGKPIIDYGAQSKWGKRLADAIAKTKRFNIKWYNIKTDQYTEYDSNEHQFRGPTMTDWRVVVESTNTPTFPRLAIKEHIFAICGEFFDKDI